MITHKWLDNISVALRLVLENAFLMPEDGFAELINSIFDSSKLADVFTSPWEVTPQSLACRIRLIDKLKKGPANHSFPIPKSDVIEEIAGPKILVELVELAVSLGYHEAVAPVLRHRPEVLIYVAGSGSQRTKSAIAHTSEMERFCSANCLQFSPFLQLNDWTDEQASMQFECWHNSLSKSKEIVCVIGHSAGCEVIVRNLRKLPVPLIFLAPDLVGESKFKGVTILLPGNEIKEGSVRFDQSNELHFFPDSTHSMDDTNALSIIEGMLSRLIGVRMV